MQGASNRHAPSTGTFTHRLDRRARASGAAGFSTFMEVAAVYLGLQIILKRKLWSITLGNIHYWSLLIGSRFIGSP